MTYRLLYVSRSVLPVDEADGIVSSIVDVAQRRNARDAVTGALVFTGDAFAQVLEGRMPAVLRLMADIADDPRHADIEIVEQGHVPAPAFGDWSMGYWGRSEFVGRLLQDMRPSSGTGRRRGNLLNFMSEWARRQRGDPPSADQSDLGEAPGAATADAIPWSSISASPALHQR